ncbi:hypothetical protein SH1V18_47950 [Vallitalea longa]|uniref:Uncharacterized protein n=1 Tax=Vallitalea longa TaxID=2936439 RepID=A0A9W5YGZ2_9FIRM|nr:hypothetical protein [Vallitalea longa]GKX32315.1 hypothetical protein SH1V18_47950 [Vallitalea longa]
MSNYKKRIGSCKLNRDIIDNKINKVTSIDIDILLLLAKYQDAFGRVRYIYYKEIIKELKIHKTSYFRALKHLSKNGIIDCDFTKREKYKDLRFINNDYSDDMNDRIKNYFNVNHYLLYTEEFRKLRKNAKVGLIRILANMNRHKGFMNIGNTKLKQYFNTDNIYLIKTYIEDIKKLITIKNNGRGKALTLFYKEISQGSIREIFLKHIFAMKMKMNNIVHNIIDIKALIKIFNIFITRESIPSIDFLINEINNLIIKYQDKGIQPKLFNNILNARFGY